MLKITEKWLCKLSIVYKQSQFFNNPNLFKSKFKDNLRSKSKTAQINELLLKILCHNICCVIQEMNELGIKGEFIVEEKIQYEN